MSQLNISDIGHFVKFLCTLFRGRWVEERVGVGVWGFSGYSVGPQVCK